MTNTISNPLKWLFNCIGKRIDRKLIVFLVDDYGSLRLSNDKAVDNLKQAGIDIDSNRFNRLDSISNANDLANLFEILTSVKDSQGRYVVFTPMTIVANPDFDRIRLDDFKSYYYRPFFELLDDFPDSVEIKNLWKEGIVKNIFVPEFHGREHLSVRYWMDLLKLGDHHILKAFEHESIGVTPSNRLMQSYMAAFEVEGHDHLNDLKAIAIDGLDLFEKTFGYRSVFFTPPGLVYNTGMNGTLKEAGIDYIDVARIQDEPKLNGKVRKRLHYMAQRNKFNQYYVNRNAMFEPSIANRDWVDTCLADIRLVFSCGKPAIISSHRVNFVGGKKISNRDMGLQQLGRLLKQIVKRWPDVEFLTVRDACKQMISPKDR